MLNVQTRQLPCKSFYTFITGVSAVIYTSQWLGNNGHEDDRSGVAIFIHDGIEKRIPLESFEDYDFLLKVFSAGRKEAASKMKDATIEAIRKIRDV